MGRHETLVALATRLIRTDCCSWLVAEPRQRPYCLVVTELALPRGACAPPGGSAMDADRAESLAKEVFSAALQAAGADEDVTEYVLSCAASVLEGASARGAVRRDAAAAVWCACSVVRNVRAAPAAWRADAHTRAP